MRPDCGPRVRCAVDPAAAGQPRSLTHCMQSGTGNLAHASEKCQTRHSGTLCRVSPGTNSQLALVMSGGGARAAYQVGMLRWLARRHPDIHVPILTGVSAGAINAAFLASQVDPFPIGVD